MTQAFIDFWKNIPPDIFVHPSDKKVFFRTRHNLRKDCLPIAYFGAIRSAPIVLLYLSPGYTEYDTELSNTLTGQLFYQKQRSGEAKLPSKVEHERVYEWWYRRIRQFQLSPDSVADKIAVLNLGAYRSRRFSDYHMLTALPSSRAALDFAHSVLFPQAENGERVVVCMRSHRCWGLGVGKRYGKALFSPSTTAAGFMRAFPMREQVIDTVKAKST